MNRILYLTCASLISIPTLLSGGELPLPEEFRTNAEVMPVQRKLVDIAREPLKFGTYQVVDHHRGWTRSKGESSSILPPYIPIDVEASNEKWLQQFRFAVAANGTPAWGCLCKVKGQADGVMGMKTSVQKLTCRLISASDTAQSWEFTLEGRTSRKLRTRQQGGITDGDVTISIDAIEAEGRFASMLGPRGFTISQNDRIDAAVDVTGKGVVYLRSSLADDDKAFLAATTAAILVYNPRQATARAISRD